MYSGFEKLRFVSFKDWSENDLDLVFYCVVFFFHVFIRELDFIQAFQSKSIKHQREEISSFSFKKKSHTFHVYLLSGERFFMK
jgi:hypothetical protein